MWDEAEAACGHNHGDCFIEANGSTVDACTYNGYFIYGMINRDNGHGIGVVYPTSLAVHDWKIWWDKDNCISTEAFTGSGAGAKKWFIGLRNGKEGLFTLGKAIVDAGTVPEDASGSTGLPPACPGSRLADVWISRDCITVKNTGRHVSQVTLVRADGSCVARTHSRARQTVSFDSRVIAPGMYLVTVFFRGKAGDAPRMHRAVNAGFRTYPEARYPCRRQENKWARRTIFRAPLRAACPNTPAT
ncbi:MAG: hypothetical protein GF418_10775 [Chitinivibrionales bacterium]|nr:hypothetical protein [Chitinivibrionales bacterium]MBD3396098.1 hypothetical protein [Chitinivibrionales bacterium]